MTDNRRLLLLRGAAAAVGMTLAVGALAIPAMARGADDGAAGTSMTTTTSTTTTTTTSSSTAPTAPTGTDTAAPVVLSVEASVARSTAAATSRVTESQVAAARAAARQARAKAKAAYRTSVRAAKASYAAATTAARDLPAAERRAAIAAAKKARATALAAARAARAAALAHARAAARAVRLADDFCRGHESAVSVGSLPATVRFEVEAVETSPAAATLTFARVKDSAGAGVRDAGTVVTLALDDHRRGAEFTGRTVLPAGAATGTYAVVAVTVTDTAGNTTTLDAAGVAAVAHHARVTVV